jgi:hypothetical protein
MPIEMRGSTATGTVQSDLGFRVASNNYNGFQIGDPSHTKYYLIAYIVYAAKEYIFNGRLLLSNRHAGTIIDNFPKGPVQQGWEKVMRPDQDGYDLREMTTGTIIFGYKIIDNICVVTTNLYDEKGNIIAESRGDDFIIHGPCIVGGGIFDIMGNPTSGQEG